jgi:hypothetical protein
MKINPNKIEAIVKFPAPSFVLYYFAHFPKKQFWLLEAFMFSIGFAMAITKPKHKSATWYVQGVATILFLLVLLAAAIWHTIAWVWMRIVEIRRARYMGITLHEYQEL